MDGASRGGPVPEDLFDVVGLVDVDGTVRLAIQAQAEVHDDVPLELLELAKPRHQPASEISGVTVLLPEDVQQVVCVHADGRGKLTVGLVFEVAARVSHGLIVPRVLDRALELRAPSVGGTAQLVKGLFRANDNGPVGETNVSGRVP